MFVEHMHDTYMASLMTALDSEKWVQADVSPERQSELDRLTAGKAVLAAVVASDPFSSGASSTRSGWRVDLSLGWRGRWLTRVGVVGDRLALGRQGSEDGDPVGAAAGAEGNANGLSGGAVGGKKKKDQLLTEAVVDDARYKVRGCDLKGQEAQAGIGVRVNSRAETRVLIVLPADRGLSICDRLSGACCSLSPC